jgi:hypothetical protein
MGPEHPHVVGTEASMRMETSPPTSTPRSLGGFESGEASRRTVIYLAVNRLMLDQQPLPLMRFMAGNGTGLCVFSQLSTTFTKSGPSSLALIPIFRPL